ncbi:Hypothetical predicted protein [Octopus vulgaris]|uniref:Uncharacterized protein n=1 Tax=Octopus vulgaris TaxID=6645 RepID=A0AA36BRA9_OCTVU|nr:Hypothetical predicted protein [Octopus vulgaris]
MDNSYGGLWISCDENECHSNVRGKAYMKLFQVLEVIGLFLAAIACAVLSLGSYHFISIDKLILVLVTLFILAGTDSMFKHDISSSDNLLFILSHDTFTGLTQPGFLKQLLTILSCDQCMDIMCNCKFSSDMIHP